MPEKHISKTGFDEMVKENPDLMINYKTDESLSPIHLFFRDYTGTILIILTLLCTYFVMILPDSLTTWLRPFFSLHGAFYQDGQIWYHKDIKDLYTVASLTILLTVLRSFLSKSLFCQIANWLHIENTLEKPQAIHKTEEQCWLVLYYTFSFSAGLTIIRKYIGFTLNNVWSEYPKLVYTWDFKLFYLIQCSFYFQCILLLFIEKHRKDLFYMLIHHVVTIVLISISYYTNFTKIGVVVFAIFDAADALLSLSKIMQYAWLVIPGYTCFIIFTCTWIYTRHYLIIVVMINIATQAEYHLPLIWDPPKGYFVSITWSKPLFLTLFTLLEILQVFWLINILKLIYRQLFKGIMIGDDRSCKDDSDEEELEKKD